VEGAAYERGLGGKQKEGEEEVEKEEKMPKSFLDRTYDSDEEEGEGGKRGGRQRVEEWNKERDTGNKARKGPARGRSPEKPRQRSRSPARREPTREVARSVVCF
jgi:hypothetical protein